MVKLRAPTRSSQSIARAMSNAAPPESNPIPNVVAPQTTEARPAASATLSAQPIWIRGPQRRPQNVVSTHDNPSTPYASCRTL